MVTTVSNSLFKRLVGAFPADRSYGRGDFSRAPMPKPINEYLEHVLRFRVQEAADTISQAGSGWFDADHPEVRQAGAAFLSTLARHQRIPAAEWADVLREACHRTVSYLVHPASALADATFVGERDSREVTPESVFSRLSFYGAYPYFRDVISAYFEQKKVERIDRERLEELVRRIDRQMTADYGAEEWVQLLQPLLSVVRVVPETSHGIPVDLLRSFFEERQARHLAERVSDVFSARNVAFVGEEELSRLFVEEPVREAPMAPRPVAEPVSPVRSPESGSLPLWKQFENGGRTAAVASAPEESKSTPSTGDGQPLWKQYRVTPAKDEAGNTSDVAALERAVLGERGSRNRDTFIKHLFSGSRDEYERTLRRLRPAPNWSMASQIIAEEVFVKHQVNIYSEPAVTFTEAAEARYRS